MNRRNPIGLAALLALAAWFFQCAVPAHSMEPAEALSRLERGDCEPIRFKATIMEIDREKVRLLVAEKWVYAFNVGIEGPVRKTELLNAEGKFEVFDKFKAGQRVAVTGYEHPDGFVLAAKIRKVRAEATLPGKGKNPGAAHLNRK